MSILTEKKGTDGPKRKKSGKSPKDYTKKYDQGASLKRNKKGEPIEALRGFAKRRKLNFDEVMKYWDELAKKMQGSDVWDSPNTKNPWALLMYNVKKHFGVTEKLPPEKRKRKFVAVLKSKKKKKDVVKGAAKAKLLAKRAKRAASGEAESKSESFEDRLDAILEASFKDAVVGATLGAAALLGQDAEGKEKAAANHRQVEKAEKAEKADKADKVIRPEKAEASAIPDSFFNAMVHQETGTGRHDVVGDNGKALGAYQIHDVYFKDAAEYDKKHGGKFGVAKHSYRECLGNQDLSKNVVNAYMNRYAKNLIDSGDYHALFMVHNGGLKIMSRSGEPRDNVDVKRIKNTVDNLLTTGNKKYHAHLNNIKNSGYKTNAFDRAFIYSVSAERYMK